MFWRGICFQPIVSSAKQHLGKSFSSLGDSVYELITGDE